VKKVLVADDEEGVREFCRQALEKKGFKVVTAQNGQEAIAGLDDSFSLILTDLEMPELDGRALIKYVRENIGRHIPIILMSWTFNRSGIKYLKFSGVDDYLVKPFHIKDLMAVINKYKSILI
jgi:DNA-binding response OmpR family regulator